MLLYPNPTDPLNAEAAQLQMKNEAKYKEKIKEYIEKYAKSSAPIGAVKKEEDKVSDVGSELSATSDLDAMDDDAEEEKTGEWAIIIRIN